MMILTPLDDQLYESAQKEIGYAKLFPYMLEDFITRKDAAEMMKPTNLPVNTAVTTTVNTAVTAPPPTGVGTGFGAGNGSGIGQASPIYNGQVPTPASIAMKGEKKAIVDGGGAVASAALGSL